MKRLAEISREAPVLIAGPTASGKSALAMDLADRDGRVIVNADALQVYDCWRVLTARPSPAEEAALPHALYGHVGREQNYSVGDWLRDLAPLLAARPVVIVGGTGLYFQALTQGLAQIPATPAAVRQQADARRVAEGLGGLLAELDPETAAGIDRRNPMRVQRAWEVLQATGKGLAAWQRSTGPALLPPGRAEALVLQPAVDWLDRRIADRFQRMLDQGALDEVRAEMPHWRPERASARAIGAAELVAHLQGRSSLDEARAAAVLATRRYAKRQRTWGRSHHSPWHVLSLP